MTKKTFLLFLIAVLSLQLKAGDETRSARVYANNMVTGSFIYSADDKYSASSGWVSGFSNYKNRAVVEFGLDEELHYLSYAFNACIKFDVAVTDASQNTTVYSNQQLNISYNPSEQTRYKDKAQLVFQNVYKIKVYNMIVTSCGLTTPCGTCTLTTNQPDLYMQAEITTERIYNFNFASQLASTDVTHLFNSTNQELAINWNYIPGAEQYELEYTYVDDYVNPLTSSPSSLTFDLDHDATRINTTNNFYNIPLTYEKGYIVYRIRSIGLSPTKERIEGAWQGAVTGNASSTPYSFNISTPFGADKYNWSSIKTFAENGKTGIGVSFTDAMGLNRQSIARLNTDKKAIVQTTLYDYYARPTVNILPAPVSGLDFNYRFNLNMYNNGSGPSVIFDKSIFNLCTTANNICNANAFNLDAATSIGAANYYSSLNPNKQGYQGYLPDAFGLPYTQIKYKPDGLSRVTHQSTPGNTHYLGSGKELKYFYAQPTQVELDRLFGAEAGRAKYYFKNITIDPNGQASATYLDNLGRTVATSLLGLNPLNVDPLPNMATTALMTESLSVSPTNDEDPSTRCKEVNSTFFVANASTEGYVYHTTLGSFASTCNIGSCYDCVYDVELSIKDDCGNEIFDNDANNSTAPGFTNTIGKQPPYIPVTCGSGPTGTFIAGTTLTTPVNIVFPKAGLYTVYKKICVSEAPIVDYTADFIANDCSDKKCTIFDSIINDTDFAGCNALSNCSECMQNVLQNAATISNSTGTVAVLGNTLPNQAGGSLPTNTTVAYVTALSPQEISAALENCANLCIDKTPCGKFEKKLLADFYPNSGQYASAYSIAQPGWNYSIFNPNNLLSSNVPPHWALSPPSTYLNAAGSPDGIQIGGTIYPPQSAPGGVTTYTNMYKKSWAKSFLTMHPEYCKYYFYCNVLGSSLLYDEQFSSIRHFDTACYAGYIKPVIYSGTLDDQPTCIPTLSNPDPIASVLTVHPAFNTLITAFYSDITSNFNSTGINIYDFVTAQFDGTQGPSKTFGADPCTADEEWKLFKTYYNVRKQKLYSDMLAQFLSSPSTFGYNGPCGTVPSGYVEHFPSISTIATSGLPAGISGGAATVASLLSPPAPFSSAAAVTAYTNSIATFTSNIAAAQSAYAVNSCDTACNDYKPLWNSYLNTGCPAYSAAGPVTQAQILAALVQVCKRGCDYNTNLEGASSVSPGNGYTLPSSGGVVVNNFQQVLNYYLGNNVCNAIILTNPSPYPSSGNNNNNNQSLTSCKCDQILQVAHNFTANPLPPGIMFEWQLFKQMYGFDLSEYNALKCLCKQTTGNTWAPGHLWTVTEITSLASNTFIVNPQLECNSCLKCTDVVAAINGLSSQFLSSISYPNVIDAITQDSTNQILALAVLNNQFGVHSLQDYIDLYADCQQFNSSGSAALTFSNTISTEALDLFHYLNQLVSNKLLTKNHLVKLCTDDKYYLSSLYNGALPTTPANTYAYTISGNSLIFTITTPPSTTTLQVTLTFPSSYSGTWQGLSYLNNLNAYCPSPAPGPNYGFIVNAVDANLSVVTLTGSITNLAFPICTLSGGSSPVPLLCPKKPKKKNTCATSLIQNALTQANLLAQQYLQNLAIAFQTAYQDACYNAINETFTRTYNGANEYQYTLYYYDQAGNLQRTVAPKGVDILPLTAALPLSSTTYPLHSSVTGVDKNYVNDYQSHSYNTPIQESTIDGGKTKYIYDEIGRIILSQNAKQLAKGTTTKSYFSYTKYDNLGRIIEVGELGIAPTAIASPHPLFSTGNSIPYTSIYVPFVLGASGNTFSEVVRTFYDDVPSNIMSPNSILYFSALGNGAENLRNRVSAIMYYNTYVPGNPTPFYQNATFYSYDDHGNVNFAVQENNTLPSSLTGPSINNAPNFKRITYDYDLISGNMIQANYQPNKVDQISHRYYYDEDNRLHEVFTTKDGVNWDRDAKYFYYEHGPLARIERADKQVQGMDFYYTIHGWIKGINSDALKISNDAGKDGAFNNSYYAVFNNLHAYFAKDAMSFGLNYYNAGSNKDFTAIKNGNYNSTSDINPVSSYTNLYNSTAPLYLDNLGAGDGPSLYNGNISSMVTSFIDKDASNTAINNQPFPQLTTYRYDQLHRLTKTKSFRALTNNTWDAPTTANYTDAYLMNLTYDLNGNIKTLKRNGPGISVSPGSSLDMDDLLYSYYEKPTNGGVVTSGAYNSNKLACVKDFVNFIDFGSTTLVQNNYNTDIDDLTDLVSSPGTCSESTPRYKYDEVGNLIFDKGEYIANIVWTVDRKVKEIIRDPAAMLSAPPAIGPVTKSDIEYQYNAMRQRVVKIVKPRNPTTKVLMPPINWIYTYYVYDASGNLSATYDRKTTPIGTSGTLFVDEITLSEHHIYGSNRLAIARPSNTLATWSYSFSTCAGDLSCRTAITTFNPLNPSGYPFETARHLGFKEFELTNHLGNVIATVSDRKVQIRHCAVIYEDFGDAIIDGVTPSNALIEVENNSLRVQPTELNGGVNVTYSTVVGTPYQMSFEIDLGTSTPDNGRTLNIFSYNPSTGDTTILGTAPINQNGTYTYTFTGQAGSIGGAKLFFRSNVNAGSQQYFYLDNFKVIDAEDLEGADPIGLDPCSNALSTFGGYFPDLLMHTDYYAFGMEMPGRKWTASNYRYGMNGMEKDDEIVGSGNIYTAAHWEYDARLGRRWNVDPITQPWQSPYATFNNNPIIFVDPSGLFATRGEARAYRKEHDLKGRVRKGSDGTFSIDNKKDGTSIFRDNDFGVTKAVLIEAERTKGKVSNINGEAPYKYDPIDGVQRGPKMADKVEAIILHRTVSSNGESQYNQWKNATNPPATHFLVGEDGTIYQTGNLQKYTIHLRDKQSGQMYEEFFGKILNSNTIGIEVIGNYNEDTKSWDPLTSQQQIATAALVNELMYRYNLEIHQVMTHEGVQRKTKGEGQTVLDAIKEDIK
jgi:RHS repeat-associated protein